MPKETYRLLACQRYVLVSKETYNRPKETYSYAKRDLQITGMSEVCHTKCVSRVKRDLFYVAKATCLCDKSDLFTCSARTPSKPGRIPGVVGLIALEGLLGV